jgi:hypothetical protein
MHGLDGHAEFDRYEFRGLSLQRPSIGQTATP